MSDRRVFRWATTSARLLAGTLVAVAFVVGVVTAVSVPWPVARTRTGRRDGHARALGERAGVHRRSARARPRSRRMPVASSPPRRRRITSGVGPDDPPPTEQLLASPAADATAPATAVVAEPADGERTDVAASGSATVSADDLRGFAASACRPALMESWLVGGSAATGAADVVLLANPGTVPASVQLTVYGAGGAQVPAGGEELTVAPGAQIVVPLAGLLPGEESPVIRVTATGAPVQAALQASITRTLVPGGVDQVGAIAVAA